VRHQSVPKENNKIIGYWSRETRDRENNRQRVYLEAIDKGTYLQCVYSEAILICKNGEGEL
jgi:hypothetical protein